MEQKKIDELKKLFLFGALLLRQTKDENEYFLKLTEADMLQMTMVNACIFDLDYDGHVASYLVSHNNKLPEFEKEIEKAIKSCYEAKKDDL